MTMAEPTAPDDQPATPSLHIDADWKAQAQAEKEKLAKAEQERSTKRRGPDDLPPADFRGLVGILASQGLMALGAYADPKSGRVVVDLEGAQFSIDLLAVLEEKTAGNLTEEESRELALILSELRNRFLRFATMVAQQQGGAAATASQSAPGPATKPIIEMP